MAGSLRRAFDREVMGALLDHGMHGVDPLRRDLLAQARGRVIEIGFGSGTNVPFYPASIDELVAVEPNEGLRESAARKLAGFAPPHRLIDASASRELPLDPGSFDVAVITFVLCSVRDVRSVITQTLRVLKPGAPILLLEHIAAPDRRRRLVQRALRPAWSLVLGGCDPARETRTLVREAGLDDTALEDTPLALPFPVSSGLVGVARPR